MAEVAACPECGGRWLYALTWQHRIDCGLQAALGATRAADFYDRRTVREATAAEVALLGLRGWEPDLTPTPQQPEPARVAVDVLPGPLWRRRFRLVNGRGQTPDQFDPDQPPA